MFKKPQKKSFRRKAANGDSEDEAEESTKHDETSHQVGSSGSSSPSVTPVAKPGGSTKSVVVETVGGASSGGPGFVSKLSFEDDSGDTEEFTLKKSTRSRRIVKQLKEEWKENSKKPNTSSTTAGMKDLAIGSRMSQLDATNGSSEETVEDFDAEMRDDGNEYRRPGLLRGQIPNKQLIADAKKRREEARKAGDEDFIPLDDVDRFVDSKSRLIREDENDLSDEDADMVMSSSGGHLRSAKEKEAENRRRNREFFVRDELIGEVLEDSDEETQRWEEAQIRKGVTLPQIQALSEEIHKPVHAASDYTQETQYTAAWSDMPADVSSAPMTTVDEIRKKIKNRMEQAKDLQRRHYTEMDKVATDVRESKSASVSLEEELKTASFEYKFYQEMRGFVWDVIDCCNNKLPLIIAAEEKTLSIWRKGANATRELRQQYIKDLSDDIHGKNSLDILPNLKEVSERRARLAEYYERKKKVAAVAKMSENDLDLDEYESPITPQPPAILELLSGAASIFDDTVADFHSLPALFSRFQDWRTSCPHSYNDAYIAHCFPKLVAPFVRFQILGWNPIKRPAPLTEMSWLEEILANAFVSPGDERVSSDDPDLRIIPMLIEDVVFSRLTALLDVWDPMSTLQCERLSNFTKKTFDDFPLIALSRKPVQEFFRKLGERLNKSIDDDIFLPVYSQRIIDSDPEARSFVTQQFRSGLKLFSNIFLFHGVLSNAALVELAVERLLNRYLLVPLRTSHNRSDSAQRCVEIASRIPEDRLAASSILSVPKHFEMFCHVVLNLGKQNSKREEVSELSRLLMRLKDFKGAEILEKQLLKKEL